jgi:uncharacterized protein YneR
MLENRKNPRFNDFGKFECEDISLLPGRLGDISLNGMRVVFDSLEPFIMKNCYEADVRLSKCNGEAIKLLVFPEWRFDSNSGSAKNVQIGFSVQHALEYDKLAAYIAGMDDADKIDNEDEVDGIADVDMTIQFIDENDEESQSNDDYLLQEDCECQFL